MKNKMKSAFDQIHAEEKLKRKTKEAISRKREKIEARQKSNFRWIAIPAVICGILIMLGIGGYWTYLMPVSSISLDINPSIELAINRFDKVLSVKGYNEDGRQLAETLDIRYMDYEKALEQIIECEPIASRLDQGEVLSIVVAGDSDAKSEEIYSQVESLSAHYDNVHCYHENHAEMERAHTEGLSFGKYHAFLKLQALDPNITIEDVKNMTMKEIYNRIEALSGKDEAEDETVEEIEDEHGCQQKQHRHGRHN